MGDYTPRRGFYRPGGGSSGSHGSDESADIDKLNDSFTAIDGFSGVPILSSFSQFQNPQKNDRCEISGVQYVYSGSLWIPDKISAQTPQFAGSVNHFDVTTQSCYISKEGSLLHFDININVGANGGNTSTASLMLATSNLVANGQQWAVPYKMRRGTLLAFVPGNGWSDPTYKSVDVEWSAVGGTLTIVRGAVPSGSGLFGALTARSTI